jgi:carbamate kinase
VTATPRRAVVALGGNALAPADRPRSVAEQIGVIAAAMAPVAELVASGVEVVLTHGNGPQVGDLITAGELAADVLAPLPLDWYVAQTQAMIGFIITTTLERELALRGLPLSVVPIITRVRVDRADPAWEAPSKPVGPYLPESEAQAKIATGQQWRSAGSKGWRRVVASPEPVELLDGQTIRLVLDAGAVVVAAGGGGIPMVREEDGHLNGVEAVVDKDLAAVLVARAVGAEVLAILTDVPGAALAYGTDEEEWLESVAATDLRRLQRDGRFPAGSMGPKVEAVCRHVEGCGLRGAIGSLEDIAEVVSGRRGTQVTAESIVSGEGTGQ